MTVLERALQQLNCEERIKDMKCTQKGSRKCQIFFLEREREMENKKKEREEREKRVRKREKEKGEKC